nr:hypothetical protein [uncultured Campylobacter sp.]
MKKFLLPLIAIFVLAGCGSDPKGVAEDFIRALYEGDSKTLVDAIDIPDKDRSDDGSMQMINGKLMQMAGAGKEEASKRGGLKSVSGELQNSDEKSVLVKSSCLLKTAQSAPRALNSSKKTANGRLRFSQKASRLSDLRSRRARRALDAHARAYGKRAAAGAG